MGRSVNPNGKWSQIARELEGLTRAVAKARIDLARPAEPPALLDLGDALVIRPLRYAHFHNPVTLTLAIGAKRVLAVVERSALAALLRRLPEPVDPAALTADDLLQVLEFAALDAIKAGETKSGEPIALVSITPGDVTLPGKTVLGELQLSGAEYGPVKLVAAPTRH